MADITKAISRATGWSYDLTRDILGTAGGAILVWFVAKFISNAILPGASEPLAAAAAGIAAASLWQRARRDSQ